MSKFTTLFMLTLLLSSMLTYTTARPGPNLVKTQNEDAEIEKNGVYHEENCDGVDKEECLIRRTLAAHIDYIYTQKQGPHKP
ncbi:phytosulfokines 3-like [Rhododendron vialii]|uniref:phytosulfokines 3-like n=1 Tax=Rhododendron vialii TaxID=182163 RepID=UPI00265F812F|nr:phytosulfokines 3-like [Rhododendron vialii]